MSWLEKKTHEYIEMRLRSGGRWGRKSVQGCCYLSAPGVAQYMSTLQVWGVGMDKRMYQREWHPGRGWSAPKRRIRDVIGSAPAVLPYIASGVPQLDVFYIMGDYPGTWESKQLIFDPASGWQAPVDWVFVSSAPALARYGTELQVWASEASN